VKALVVHAHPSPGSYSWALADAAVRGLVRAGYEVELLHLDGEGFGTAMTREERAAYHSAEPILDEQVRRHARLVRWADTLVFVYPTWWAGQPAVMKGWLERVLVPGVAFHLDPDTNVVRADLRHVRRIVGVTTYGCSRPYVWLLGDPGRRTLTRALRMLCHRRCRRTWLGLHGMDTAPDASRRDFLAQVERELARP
jgi:putative NADPH-quinone reductase